MRRGEIVGGRGEEREEIEGGIRCVGILMLFCRGLGEVIGCLCGVCIG
jgi:hypothetical protein